MLICIKSQENAIKKVDFGGIYYKMIRFSSLFVNVNELYRIAWICSNVYSILLSSESNLPVNVVIMMENARYLCTKSKQYKTSEVML